MQKEDIINWQDLAFSDYNLFSPMRKNLKESENFSDEVAQKTVNRILQGRDTCSHSKVENWY